MVKSPCGGFYIDNDTLYVEDSILKARKQEFEIPEQIKYKSGEGIIIQDNIISVNGEIAKKQDISNALNNYKPNVDLSEIENELQELNDNFNTATQQIKTNQQDITNIKQNVESNTLNINNNTQKINNHTLRLNNLETKDTELVNTDISLQQQIDDLKTYNENYEIPIATAGSLSVVMPRQGLVVDRVGALNTTIQQYLDLSCGMVFLPPNSSKTVKLYHPCYIIYLEFYLVDSVNVASPYMLYMSNITDKTITKNYLTATFDTENGTYVALTNNHSTNGMFVHYGCDDLRLVEE